MRVKYAVKGHLFDKAVLNRYSFLFKGLSLFLSLFFLLSHFLSF